MTEAIQNLRREHMHPSKVDVALLVGGSLAVTAVLFPVALVAGSGSSARELGGELWKSTEDARGRFVRGFSGFFDAIGDDLNSRQPISKLRNYGRNVLEQSMSGLGAEL